MHLRLVWVLKICTQLLFFAQNWDFSKYLGKARSIWLTLGICAIDHLGDFYVDKRSTGFKKDPNINIWCSGALLSWMSHIFYRIGQSLSFYQKNKFDMNHLIEICENESLNRVFIEKKVFTSSLNSLKNIKCQWNKMIILYWMYRKCRYLQKYQRDQNE